VGLTYIDRGQGDSEVIRFYISLFRNGSIEANEVYERCLNAKQMVDREHCDAALGLSG